MEERKDRIVVRKENGVAWLTINRPDVLNACDLDTLRDFQVALKDFESDSSVRCIVITGAGRAFCAGADLQSLINRRGEGKLSISDDLRYGFNPIISKIRSIEKPVIAMINGVAAGAGMGIAFACDLRIMSESARFVEAFAKVGLVPDSGSTFFMTRLLGLTRAMELAFTGEGIDAKECERLGIVNKVVRREDLETETRKLAEKLARGPRSIGLSKRALNRALSLDLDGALEYEAYLQEIAGRTHDFEEGINSFIGKREPNFEGK
jgi:2-(1,2-epoxy-1,2-dihydrophenyl)acetyl-CoA isomerase